MATESKLIANAVEFVVEHRLVIADPCYIDLDDGNVDKNLKDGILSRDGGGVVLKDCEGTWVGEIVKKDLGSWGTRVAKLRLKRQGVAPMLNGLWEHVGNAGVDSGQMGGFCSTRLPLDYDALLAAYQTGEDGGWENHLILAFGGGVVSSTGIGDGLYDVSMIRSRGGDIAEVVVDFGLDEEGDDDDGWG